MLSGWLGGICQDQLSRVLSFNGFRPTEDKGLERRTPNYNLEPQRLYVKGCFRGQKSLPAKESHKESFLFIGENVSLRVCNYRPYLKQV